ncbi:hypothetical protein CCH79_00003108, partial [Gambusia affinis]
MVRNVISSLFLHPLLKNQVFKKNARVMIKAWRHELRDLAANDQPYNKQVLRKTQCSAETGRIIPPSTTSFQHKSIYKQNKYPQPLHNQEFMSYFIRSCRQIPSLQCSSTYYFQDK